MKPFTNLKAKLFESSLSRLVQHMKEHDTGTITAYRDQYSKKENQQRNKSLLVKLMAKGYGVTAVKGSYIEDYGTPEAKEVGESVFFVTDLKDRGNLEKDLKKLGEEFDQDSILFIPKTGKKGSRLVGTNKTGFPGYGKIKNFPILKFGKTDSEFLTKVSGRPFYFKESIISEHVCGQNNTRYLVGLEAKKKWTEMEV